MGVVDLERKRRKKEIESREGGGRLSLSLLFLRPILTGNLPYSGAHLLGATHARPLPPPSPSSPLPVETRKRGGEAAFAFYLLCVAKAAILLRTLQSPL